LPEGLDPCDLLVQEGGPERFREILAGAVDALDFKLNQLLAGDGATGIEGRRRAVDAVLSIMAQAPEVTAHAGAVKRELMITRIAHRLALKEKTVWDRLRELQQARKSGDKEARKSIDKEVQEKREAPAPPRERQLLQMLLAEPGLVPLAAAEIRPDEVEHPGLRRLLEGLYTLQAAGEVPDLDGLRPRMMDVPGLAEAALKLQFEGRLIPDRAGCLRGLAAEFRRLRELPHKQELQQKLQAVDDHSTALDLLRRLQKQSVGPDF
jgi:DNA primase